MLETSDLSQFRSETTCQVSTFDPDKKVKTLSLPHGQTVCLAEVAGQGKIVQFWMTFPGWFWQHWNPQAPISQTILKTLVLRFYWDGSDRPAIEAPVADFFGLGLCEIGNFASQYFGMSSGGFFCKFPMPFRQGFRIELENLDETIDTRVFANVLYQKTENAAGQAGYLHTQFHTGRMQGPEPVTILEARGRGHYVGCNFAGQGEQPAYLSFLEAPEYIWIDDEGPAPRIVGTGLEDYFLGGWYFREGTFSGPLHGLPAKDALNSSAAMYRIHVQDAIRFEKSIRFQFLNPWQPERLKPYAYSALAFVYIDSPHGSPVRALSSKDLLVWYRIKNTDHYSIP